MKDWNAYSQSKARQNEVTGSRPSVFEYAFIKIIDNWVLFLLVIMTFIFSIIGLLANMKNVSVDSWFFDAAKLTLGVMLGILTKLNKKS